MPAVSLRSIKFIFFSRWSWNVGAGRQKPGMAVHPSAPLCPSVQVWELFSALSEQRHWCVRCFSPAPHHFISYPERACFEEALADAAVCFWLLWGGFKRLFLLFFVSLLKENPLGFYRPPVPHGLTAQTHLNENSVFQLFFDTWNNRFHKLLCCSEEKGCDDVSFNWFSSAYKCSSCYVYLHKLDLFYASLSFCISLSCTSR